MQQHFLHNANMCPKNRQTSDYSKEVKDSPASQAFFENRTRKKFRSRNRCHSQHAHASSTVRATFPQSSLMSKPALGRGLGALLGNNPVRPPAAPAAAPTPSEPGPATAPAPAPIDMRERVL